jgi:hypothetical protein
LNTLVNLRKNSALLLFAASQILFVVVNLSFWLTGTEFIITSIGILPGIWAVIEWGVAVRRSRHGGPAGILFASAALSYFAGVGTYQVLGFLDIETKYPSFADLCFLALPMLLVGGCFGYARRGNAMGTGRCRPRT